MPYLLTALSNAVLTALRTVGEVSQVVGSHLVDPPQPPFLSSYRCQSDIGLTTHLVDPPQPPLKRGENFLKVSEVC